MTPNVLTNTNFIERNLDRANGVLWGVSSNADKIFKIGTCELAPATSVGLGAVTSIPFTLHNISIDINAKESVTQAITSNIGETATNIILSELLTGLVVNQGPKVLAGVLLTAEAPVWIGPALTIAGVAGSVYLASKGGEGINWAIDKSFEKAGRLKNFSSFQSQQEFNDLVAQQKEHIARLKENLEGYSGPLKNALPLDNVFWRKIEMDKRRRTKQENPQAFKREIPQPPNRMQRLSNSPMYSSNTVMEPLPQWIKNQIIEQQPKPVPQSAPAPRKSWWQKLFDWVGDTLKNSLGGDNSGTSGSYVSTSSERYHEKHTSLEFTSGGQNYSYTE